jgi:hypothetical protein
MYADVKPCALCGSEVRLEPREAPIEPHRQPVGPADGVVGGADETVDLRVCTNPGCPSGRDDASGEQSR